MQIVLVDFFSVKQFSINAFILMSQESHWFE